MNKKDIATSFLRLASSGQVREAHEQFIHSQFRHHNAHFKGDRESLFKGMEELVEVVEDLISGWT